MTWDIVAILLSLCGLEIGTQLVVNNAIRVSKRHGVPESVIGLSILAIGTDLPELVISLDAALRNLAGADASGIVIGNALGSALAQIGFVLGCAGLFGVLTVSREYIFRHGSALLGSIVLLFLVGLDGEISRIEGVGLVVVYVIYLAGLFDESTRVSLPEEEAHNGSIDAVGALSSFPTRRAWLLLLLGLSIVMGSAELAVTTATSLAHAWAIDQSVVAILILGLGSSLPELAISTKAAFYKRPGLSVGNLIGSNIFDTLFPVGIAALISPLRFDPSFLRFEIPYLFALSLLALLFFARRKGIHHREAGIALGAYLFFAVIKLATS